jgi:transcriptional regulator with XRE-family HTH domain
MEQISSGIKSLDLLIDHISIGNNVVWEVDAGTSYELFVQNFIKQSFKDAQKVIYISFNRSPQSILNEIKGIVDPELFVLFDCFTAGKGKNDATFLNFYSKPRDMTVVKCEKPADIDAFTVMLNELEDKLPPGARYIFDSLTGMQDLWGEEGLTYKFFTYMCPRLFDLGTVAFWILEAEAHSKNFKANLRHITQDVFELYVQREKQYIKALKLSGRQNREAFKPHVYEIVNGEVNIQSAARDLTYNLGAKIKEIRMRRELSQKDLADKTNVTPSFISQLESNQISPSLRSFMQICRVLDINPSYILDEERTAPLPKIFRGADLPGKLRPRGGGMAEHILFTGDNISVVFLLLPGGYIVNGHFHDEKGNEFIYVVRGEVSVSFGDRQEVLGEGDSMFISDLVPDQWRNKGGDDLELLVVRQK